MQQLAQVLKFSTINESFRKKNDPKSKTLVLFQFLVGAAARAAQCLTSCLPTSSRPASGLVACKHGQKVMRYAGTVVVPRLAAAPHVALGASCRRCAPPPTWPWRARRPPWQGRAPPTAEAAEISTFWLIKLGKTSSAEG